MIKDTTDFIKSCISCQLLKIPVGKTSGLLQPIPIDSGKPLQRLTFDYLGPLPSSHGKKYLIVATCNATKVAFAKAVANATGAEIINFLMDLITSYGTNGMPELMNKIICNSLTHYVNKNQKDWVLYYKLVVFAYNTCPSSRLKISPFFLLHGIEANQQLDNKIIPNIDNFNLAKSLETLQEVKEKIPNIIRKEQQTQKLNYDKTFMILIIASAIAEEKISITISSGAFFNEVP
ncbi:Transposon Ty3-I Gag-Pol polyprotein, partial [Aphis craccivora]